MNTELTVKKTITLNSEQQAAVQAPLFDCSILAGAGSGKTRVIVERIAYMIEPHWISPYDIVALTYTRKAAGEMKERLLDRIGRKAHQLFVGTIHGWCLNQLYRYGDAIGWKPSTMSVFDTDQAKAMLDWTLEDLGFMKNGKIKKIKRRDLDRAFLSLETTSTMPSDKDLCRVLTAFARGCKESNALTYPMILGEMLSLLDVNEVRDIIQNKVKHLILDEVQDTTPLQFRIVSLLQPETRYLVGDIRQSIFGFAGANLLETVRELSKGHLYYLSSNYRSTAKIVTAGNRVMEHHQPMVATIGNGPDITITPATSENIEDIVLDLLEDGFMPGEIAILCRAHRPLVKCVAALESEDFPVYYPKAKGDIYKSTEVTKLLALLALTVNPWDVFAFRTATSGWNAAQVKRQRIITKAKTEMIPVAHAWNIIDEWAPDDTLIIPAQIIEHPVICEGLQAFGVSPDDFTEVRLGETEEITTKIASYLKWVALRDLQANQEKIPENHIQALSIHQSKGLEFGAVILVGASEGILPSRQSKTPEDIEEERRLFYVAVTRAKDRLIICPRPEEEASRFLSAVR